MSIEEILAYLAAQVEHYGELYRSSLDYYHKASGEQGDQYDYEADVNLIRARARLNTAKAIHQDLFQRVNNCNTSST